MHNSRKMSFFLASNHDKYMQQNEVSCRHSLELALNAWLCLWSSKTNILFGIVVPALELEYGVGSNNELDF